MILTKCNFIADYIYCVSPCRLPMAFSGPGPPRDSRFSDGQSSKYAPHDQKEETLKDSVSCVYYIYSHAWYDFLN